MWGKNKIETIDFATFLAGNREKQSKRLVTTKVFGFLPAITPGSFFSTPDITGLYAVVIGVAAFGMLSHALEITAASYGYEGLAASIETVTRILFPVAGFIYVISFLLSL